jgi:hypothetical protein
MPVANVTTGQPITEVWGDSVADSVNALEAWDTAHVAAADPHPGYRLESAPIALADLANMATSRILGRVSGGSGAPEVLTPAQVASLLALTHTINFLIDGGGAVITTGIKGDLVVDFPCTITRWTLLGDVSGSIVVDIWRDSYANFPPVVGDKITAAAPPTIAGATKGQSAALTGWSPAIAAGDVLRFNVNSAASITRATLALTVTRT